MLDKLSTVHYLRVAYWLKMSQFLPHHCWPKGCWFFCSTLIKLCNNEPGNFKSIKTTKEVISHAFFSLHNFKNQLWRNMRRDVWLSSMIYHWITLCKAQQLPNYVNAKNLVKMHWVKDMSAYRQWKPRKWSEISSWSFV